MKSLVEYIAEKCEEELEVIDAINYEQFGDLIIYLDSHDLYNERKQAICDVFRRSYSTNVTKDSIKSSEIFQRLIDDIVSSYNNDIDSEENKIELNNSTRKHLEDDIAAKMLVKISLEQELPTPEETEE